jgi:hypothetical protein
MPDWLALNRVARETSDRIGEDGIALEPACALKAIAPHGCVRSRGGCQGGRLCAPACVPLSGRFANPVSSRSIVGLCIVAAVAGRLSARPCIESQTAEAVDRLAKGFEGFNRNGLTRGACNKSQIAADD